MPQVPPAPSVPQPRTTPPATAVPSEGEALTGDPAGPAAPTRKLPSWLLKAALPLTVAVVAGFVAATGYLIVTEPRPTADVGRWLRQPSAEPVASATEGPFGAAQEPGANDRSGNPFAVAAPGAKGPPTRLRVPAIGVDTGLETLRIGPDGELAAPESYTDAGYYADGTMPGDPGPAVIAGHVDSQAGPAVFFRLREIEAGDRIEVVRGGRTVRFTVQSTAWYPKKDFPTERVYGPTPDRQLRLITCGGVFDRSLRSYRDNFVVYAVTG